MGGMFRKRTGVVAVFAIAIAGMFAPSALATTPLTASKTATAHWTKKFDWTIDKSVNKAAIEMMSGSSSSATYTVAVTKSAGVEEMWVDGEVCASNEGTIPTEGLAISDRIVVFKANGNTQTLDRTDIDVSANPVLDPGESDCYGYSFPFTPFPDAVGYENRTSVTITNDPRSPGEPLGPTADAPFTVPASPTLINDTVNVDDTNGMSWMFSASGSKTYSRTFYCDRDKGTHTNTAKIRETGQSDTASVVVTCKKKPDCPKGHDGKGKDKDDWNKGYGWGNNNRGYDDDRRGNDRCDDDDDHHGGGGHHDDDDDYGHGDCGDRRGGYRGWYDR